MRAEGRISPLWRRAPTVLLRYPWLLGSIVFGSLLLSFTVTAYPLFISATEANLARARLTNPVVTPYGAGVEYRVENLPFGHGDFSLDRIGRQFEDRIAREPLLGPTTEGVLGASVGVFANGKSATAGGRLFAGADAYRHVRVVQTDGGRGAWIAQLTADDLGVGPGDTVSVATAGARPVRLRVSTVYRSLYTEPRAPYWYRWQFDIYKKCRFDCEPPPPFILIPQSRLVDLGKELRWPYATYAWGAPVRDPSTFTLDKALALQRFTTQFTHDASDPGRLGGTFHCCRLVSYAGGITTSMTSSIRSVISDTAKKMAPVQEPGRVLEIAAMIVALAVLAIAGWFAAAGRRVEEGLLQARGTSPRAILLKGAVETALPCLIGVAAGLGLAFLLIDVVRPSGLVGSSALRGVVPTAAASVAASVLLLAVATTVSYVRTGRAGGRALGLRHVPWEVGLIAFTIYLFGRLTAGGGFVLDPVLHVRKPSPLLVAFPVVAIAGFAILGARLFVWAMRQLRTRGGQGASSGYLAVRRLTSAAGLTVLLVAASVVCLGLFVQAQVVTRSLETTVEAKAKLFVGSDVQAQVGETTPLPASFPLPITKVTEVLDAGTLPNGASFDVLAIDPATFESAAYWNSAFSDLSMHQIVQRLSEREGGSAPILMAGAPGISPRSISMQGITVPVRTVGTASAFPGVLSQRPLVVITRDALGRASPEAAELLGSFHATTSLWVRGDTRTALQAVHRLPDTTFLVLTASHVEDIPEFHATLYTFLVLDALGLVAALLVFAGILMYLQARFRSQVVSFGLSLRMGMTETTHRRAVVIEVASVLVFAYALGLVLATATSLLLVSHLDPLPSIPPTPLYVAPPWVLVAGLLGVIAVSWLGGWISDRRARSVDLGEVMRLAA